MSVIPIQGSTVVTPRAPELSPAPGGRGAGFPIVILTFLLLTAAVGRVRAAMPTNRAPELSNIRILVDEPAGRIVVRYDLAEPEAELCEVSVQVSADDGRSFGFPVTGLTGDLGFPVSPGRDKSFSWPYDAASLDLEGRGAARVRMKLAVTDRQAVPVAELVGQVSPLNLSNTLAAVEGIRHPTGNPRHLDGVRQLIQSRFLSATPLVRIQAYGSGTNYIAHLAGFENERAAYALSAHYDSVADSPGADDNASGVAGLLEALRVLAPYSFRRSIDLVAFDQEEVGLVGSRAFALRGITEGTQLLGVLNFEMIGCLQTEPNTQRFPPGFNLLFPEVFAAAQAAQWRGDFLASIANAASNPLGLRFAAASTAHVPGLRLLSIAVPGNGEIAPDLRRSDHSAFWDRGIPALMLTDTSEFRYAHYHSPDDTSANLDFGFMGDVVRASVAALAELAGVSRATVLVTDDIVPGERLCVVPDAGATVVKVSWVGSTRVRLQQAPSVVGGGWQDVAGSEGRSELQLPLPDRTLFLRLVRRP